MACKRALLTLLAICLPVSAYALPTYKEPPASNYPESTSAVQRTFDQAMQDSSTLAGVPNATSRGYDNRPKLKAVPNALDRMGKDFTNFADDVGGARQSMDTKKGDFPRRTLKTYSVDPGPDMIIPQTAISVNDPVYEDVIIPPTNSRSVTRPTSRPVSTTAPVPTMSYEEPVITSNGDGKTGFMYRKIDQRRALTTPAITR